MKYCSDKNNFVVAIGVNAMLSTALKTLISVFSLFGQKIKPNAGVQASFFKTIEIIRILIPLPAHFRIEVYSLPR